MKEIKLSWYELFLLLYLGRRVKDAAELQPINEDRKEIAKVCNLLEDLLNSNNADIFTIRPIEQ